MNQKLFIPTKIKVGFQERNDTYTKKLAYIIYNDGKVWRKEKSWDQWTTKVIGSDDYEKQKKEQYDGYVKSYTNLYDSYKSSFSSSKIYSYYKNGTHKSIDINQITLDEFIKELVGDYDKFKFNVCGTLDKSFTPQEFDNIPIEGFVLNKKAGGYSSGWNHRQTYCRVYDPRGFEFEINIENLLYILEHCSSIGGKGLEGKFVYSWDGLNLVLLPVNAEEYKSSIEHTNLQSKTVAKSELVEGSVYKAKGGGEFLYLGHHPFVDGYYKFSIKKRHVFIDIKNKNICHYEPKHLAELVLDKIDNYADYYQKFVDSRHYYDKTKGSFKSKSVNYHNLPRHYLFSYSPSSGKEEVIDFDSFYTVNQNGSYDYYRVYCGDNYNDLYYSGNTLTKLILEKYSNVTFTENGIKIKVYKTKEKTTIKAKDIVNYNPCILQYKNNDIYLHKEY